jgi:hypothetical protein
MTKRLPVSPKHTVARRQRSRWPGRAVTLSQFPNPVRSRTSRKTTSRSHLCSRRRSFKHWTRHIRRPAVTPNGPIARSSCHADRACPCPRRSARRSCIRPNAADGTSQPTVTGDAHSTIAPKLQFQHLRATKLQPYAPSEPR